jgi:hypothetical protein
MTPAIIAHSNTHRQLIWRRQVTALQAGGLRLRPFFVLPMEFMFAIPGMGWVLLTRLSLLHLPFYL